MLGSLCIQRFSAPLFVQSGPDWLRHGMKQNKPSAQTATIREIARRAEVSIASVSRALNGKPGISDALRDKILTISREVAYQPARRRGSSLAAKPPS
ncbi:hypothetical protein HAALTHF_49930n [Vreelandella aquamarina]|nr:hypothetical protein HAALTHF_49930n [Halomonas axialensis]